MPRVLLDTSTYIDMQRAKNHLREAWAINTLRHAAEAAGQGKPYLSTMAVMEIRRGLELEQSPGKLQNFIQHIIPNFEIIGFDFEAACLGGEIYAKLQLVGKAVGAYDVGIAAIALQQKLTLITSNLKHFQRIVDLGFALEIESWRDA